MEKEEIGDKKRKKRTDYRNRGIMIKINKEKKVENGIEMKRLLERKREGTKDKIDHNR